MSTNWMLLTTGEIIGTAYCGPNKTPAFQWEMPIDHLKLFSPDLIVEDDNGNAKKLGEFLKEMLARPIQR